ncbi:hypothetical protein EB796_010846 [Bugula neritina]|uniref:Uncharacterized protein n=1 Tax=Bugula neritina TaxID=10212 RepID=A0A7J7JYP8_BUGNE|nr:hypothetical protein EB796_010846 [Bugula neritina]
MNVYQFVSVWVELTDTGAILCGLYHNMEDYTNILKLEELTIKYQKKAESSRNWVHHLQTLENIYAILAENVNNSVVINKRLKLLKTDVEVYNFLPTFKSFGPPDNTKLRVKGDIFRYQHC